MASLTIVEDFDGFENVVAGFVAGLVVAMMHQLGFQCVEKTINLLFLEPLKSVSG